jgi:hypothetical protein
LWILVILLKYEDVFTFDRYGITVAYLVRCSNPPKEWRDAVTSTAVIYISPFRNVDGAKRTGQADL